VIALVGRRDPGEKTPSPEILEISDALKSENRLLELSGAPFGRLFPGIFFFENFIIGVGVPEL
jgi:hypothetical protein